MSSIPTNGEKSLEEFIKIYTQTMTNTLNILKIYQEFLRANNELVEKITANFIDLFEKNQMNINLGFLMGVVTGYQKAKSELSPSPTKEPANHFM